MQSDDVLAEVAAERRRQDEKWGEQNHPDGTHREWAGAARDAQVRCDLAAQVGKLSWRLILEEEIAEAFAEEDPLALRQELIQVAAVAVQWAEAISRRQAEREVA